MNTQSFTDAQQAADVAYDMTLAETGDAAQASDDYKSVMTAYYAAQPDYSRAAFERNVIAKRHGDMTGIGWPLQDMINTVKAARNDSETWDCNFCGIAQPAWARDCLTCEQTDMMGRTD